MMATELVRPSCIKEENTEIPLIPPGFESFAALNVKNIEDRETKSICSASTSVSESHPARQIQTQLESNDSKLTRNLRRRSGLSYSQFDDYSGDEFDSEQNIFRRPCLPKGVIRGCRDCSTCQMVTAKWRPQDARRPDLADSPVFYPNEEEFKDTLAYIASIKARAEKYGICRIVPPSSWKPPCPILEKNTWEKSLFRTRVQKVDKLQNRDSVQKMLRAYYSKRKRRRCTKNVVGYASGPVTDLGSYGAGNFETEYFGFEPGPEFTLHGFEKYANDFKVQYFPKNGNNMTPIQEEWEPSVENIEGEYWRMVEKPTEEIEVLYGADLETGAFGSGFPRSLSNQGSSVSDEEYVRSGWNLNNFPRLPGSVLSYEPSDISGVVVPWLYIGMCFSSFCWHVEDHFLYSLNYLHWGAPKLWYGVPGEEAVKLEAAMRKHLPDLFEEQPDLLHKLVTQLSPSILKSEGVPVYRCVQNPGEFVLTFPRAYHSGFNCGFNCAEAVNVAPMDWLPHGYNAIELYRKQGRKTSISHDKLLLGAAREAVKAHWELELMKKNTSDNLKWKIVCGTDGILSKALKTRIEMELVRRESLCISSQAVKMDSSFDATSERECCVCFFDLHLSAVGCHCSPERYTCLYHANHLCSCAWNAKFYLFRYDINELSILVDAVKGKLSAIYRWARLDLGLALSSQPSKGNPQVTEFVGHLSRSSEGKAVIEANPCPPATSFKVIIKKEHVDKVNVKKEHVHKLPKSCGTKGKALPPPKNIRPVEVVLALEAVRPPPSTSPNPLLKVKVGNYSSHMKKEGIAELDANPRTSSPQKSQQDKSTTDGKLEAKKNLFLGNADVIVLSDDDDVVVKAPILRREKPASAENAELSERLQGPGDTLCDSKCSEDPKPNSDNHTSDDTITMGDLLADQRRNSYSSSSESAAGGGAVKCETLTEANPLSPFSYRASTCMVSDKPVQNLLNTTGTSECNITDDGSGSGDGHLCGKKIPDGHDRHGVRPGTNLISSDDVQSTSGSPPNTQRSIDQPFQRKGPQIAKVVRRISCNVEPLEYGVVHSGKLWCDSRAIFPRGFRSRVRYINVLDPTGMCYYVSEILDGGLDRPLFMVSVEHCPSEIFVHVSAGKCWEMVRERVNQEITKQHKSGRTELHPLQPPGSLDGLEMFGFSSPAIVQVIQAMDESQVCTEYWKSRPLVQMSQLPPFQQNIRTSDDNNICNDKKRDNSHLLPQLPTGVGLVFGSLLNKADPEELEALYSALSDDNKSIDDRGLVSRLLNQEIHSRQR